MSIDICFYCGGVTDPTPRRGHPAQHTIDHLVPIVAGGGNHPENLVTACKGCNSRKGGLDPRESTPDRLAARMCISVDQACVVIERARAAWDAQPADGGPSEYREREPPVSIRLTPDRRAWIDAQRRDGEADGAVVARLLDEYRLVQVSPAVAATVRSLRRLAQRIERGEIVAD